MSPRKDKFKIQNLLQQLIIHYPNVELIEVVLEEMGLKNDVEMVEGCLEHGCIHWNQRKASSHQ